MNYRNLFITIFLLSLPCFSTVKAMMPVNAELNDATNAERDLAAIATQLAITADWKGAMQDLTGVEKLRNLGASTQRREIISNLLYVELEYDGNIGRNHYFDDNEWYYSRYRVRFFIREVILYRRLNGYYDEYHIRRATVAEAGTIIDGLATDDDKTRALNSLKSYVAGLQSRATAKKEEIESAKEAGKAVLAFAGNQISTFAQNAQEARQAAVMAKINDQSFRSRSMVFLNFFKSPKNLATLACGLGGIVLLAKAGYELSTIGGKQLEKFLNKPKLIKETTRPENLWQVLVGKEMEEGRLSEFVAPAALKKDTEDIITQTQLAQENGVPFTNVMLYGPPGTGKTMFAKSLARESGLEFAMMSGADFSSFENVGDAILELHKIIDWGENSEKGLLIFVDEAECFLQERTFPDTHPRSVQLTNAFLSRVEKPSSNKVMWVFATNNRGVLDVAVESRIGKALEFALPDANGRKGIFFTYIEKYLNNEGISVDDHIESKYNDISGYLNGLSGRSIEEIVMEARRQAVAENNSITFDMMKHIMKRMSDDLTAKNKAREDYMKARYGK
jgi:ATP-dependent 26S proteasome regulatory subunit